MVSQQSEPTQRDFKDFFDYMKTCGKSVFIIGPFQLKWRSCFSPLLFLNVWPQSTCRTENICFGENVLILILNRAGTVSPFINQAPNIQYANGL